MTRPYCTIFNSLYVVRGLALHASLTRHDPDFRLYVFAMDPVSAATITALGDSRVVVVRPQEFEDQRLLAVKPTRSIAEYYWTCTPSIIRYCLQSRGEAECTYVDADVWLLADPAPLFAEMGEASILLTDHNFSARHEQAATHGKYCVQFMRFVASPAGLEALEWWRDRCIEWCYAREEAGRFGDQKYLDDWPTRFRGVHVLRNPGGGVAPWNVGRYHFRGGPERVIMEQAGGAPNEVIFFHFHGLRTYSPRLACLGYGYGIPREAKKLIYLPYLRELSRLYRQWSGGLTGMAASSPAPATSSGANLLMKWVRYAWGLPNTHRYDGDSR